jgi:elongation of very long chain fatty acids protein 4
MPRFPIKKSYLTYLTNFCFDFKMARAMWVYYLIKLVDLLDTVLFALRKKSNQISFLHVFHHFSMVINSWLGVKYVAGGQSKLSN